MTDNSPLIRPIPRRTFDMTPMSTNTSSPRSPPSPTSEGNDPAQSESPGTPRETAVNRTRSILNLTSSTLFGIYAPSEDSSTPWGNGAQTPLWRGSLDDKRPPIIGAYITPVRQESHPHHHLVPRDTFISLLLRTVILFVLGIAYGVIIIHLHDDNRLAPVKVEGIERYSSWYLLTWGVAGVLLGNFLPWVDTWWEEPSKDNDSYVGAVDENDQLKSSGAGPKKDEPPAPPTGDAFGANWTLVIRSAGAFIGIALAIVSFLTLPNDLQYRRLMPVSAETSLGIYASGLTHTGPGQSRAVVCCRPFKAGIRPVYDYWNCGHCYRPAHQSEHGTLPSANSFHSCECCR